MSEFDDSIHIQNLLKELQKCVKAQSSPPEDGYRYCNATTDFFGCWNYTRAGTTVAKRCPAVPGFDTNGMAYKNCTEDGTWYVNNATNREYANYDECRMTDKIHEDLLRKVSQEHLHIYISLVGFSVSIALLIISLFIFFKFRQLRCDRITLHKNLFISYLLTAITFILYNVLVILDEDVLHNQPIWCIGLHVVAQYCVVCNFFWMFCEGVYLHTIMVKVFSTGKWLVCFCYIVGWGLPVIFVTIYTIVRASMQEENLRRHFWCLCLIPVLVYAIYLTHDCWMAASTLQWIMFAPVVASIILNFIFLCNIVRLLITKLRQIPEAAQTSSSENVNGIQSLQFGIIMDRSTSKHMKAARATLILIPLLGMQFLLLPMRPEEGSELEDVYVIAVALLVSLQGAFVSIMFCFCNGEVITVVKRKWNLYTETTFNRDKRSRASSTIGTTTYTLVDHMSGVATSLT